jgi:hypothetical protein
MTKALSNREGFLIALMKAYLLKDTKVKTSALCRDKMIHRHKIFLLLYLILFLTFCPNFLLDVSIAQACSNYVY